MSVLVVRINSDDAEIASDWLFQLGANAIEDRTDSGDAMLVAGFDSDDAALAARSVLTERWPCRLEDTGDEAEWRDVWLRYIEPVEAGGFVIHAPWHDRAGLPGARDAISIDPGRAFGSGHHPTTRLALGCLRELVQPGDTVLDAGCGTGILAIAAAKLGAEAVLGIDLDHDVLEVASANVEANGVLDSVTLSVERVGEIVGPYDIVVANIVIGDLAPLVPDLVRLTGRAVAISGFLDDRFDRLVQSVDVEVVERRREDEWGAAVLSPHL